LGPGDFFGVISCMSRRPRVDTVVSMTPCSLIVIKREQFSLLIQKNAPVAIKIIRYFSKKLREYNDAITKLSLHDVVDISVEHLFNVGEYYFNQGEYPHAIYAYRRYLQYLPNGKMAKVVKRRLSQIPTTNLPASLLKNTGFSRKYPDNTMIFCEGEPGKELYIIQKGQVKITKIVGDKEVLLAVLKKGDIFGEMSLLDNKPRSASAITDGDCHLLVINKSNFETMVKTQPQLATRLIELLSERIWMAHRQLENLLIPDKIGRMYDMLLNLIEKNRAPIGSKEKYKFAIGPKELIKMVGIDMEEGMQLMKEMFKRRKLLSLDKSDGKIICLDTEELKKTADSYKKKIEVMKKRMHEKEEM